MRTINSKFKELGKHGFVYGIGTAIESTLNIILIPLYLKKFSPEEFGIFAIIQLTATLSGSFFYFGSSSAFSRFYFDKEYSDQQDKLFKNSLTICTLGSLLMILLSLFLKNIFTLQILGSVNYSLPFVLLIFSSAFSMINTNFFLLMRLKKNSLMFVLSKIISLLVSAIAIILLLQFLTDKITAVSLGFLIGQFVVFISLIIPNIKLLSLRFDKKIVLSFLSFGIPIAISSFLYIFLDWILRYLISIKLGQTELGIFSMGQRFAMLIQAGFITPFSLIWSVMRLEYRNDSNSIKFFEKIFTYYFLIGLLLIIFFSLSINSFYLFNSDTNNYSQIVYITPLLLTGQLIFGTINIVDFGIYVNNKTKYFIISNLIAISFVFCFGIIFLTHIGIVGASVIYILGYLSLALSIFLFSSKYFKFIFDKTKVFTMFVCGGIIYFITSHLSNLILVSSTASFIINIILFFCCLLIFFKLIDQDDKNSAINYIKSKF